jgi:hypothetical protein
VTTFLHLTKVHTDKLLIVGVIEEDEDELEITSFKDMILLIRSC